MNISQSKLRSEKFDTNNNNNEDLYQNNCNKMQFLVTFVYLRIQRNLFFMKAVTNIKYR